MPIVAGGDLTLLRAQGHRSDVYTSFLIPPILWQARINDAGIVQGQTDIAFDTGTGSFFALIEAIQDLHVGVSAGKDDVGGVGNGRLRIKSISSGDGGVTGTVNVGGHSLPLQDAQYLTFLHDYPLRPRYSFIDPSTETWFIDDDETYSDQHEQPPPVVIAGPNRADFLVSGTVNLIVDASGSYAIADGASISSFALSVSSTAGSASVTFNTSSGLGDIDFTVAGYYWARFSATDSNGKTQVSYRLYIIHDPDPTGFYPYVDAQSITLTGDWNAGGWIAGFESKDNHSLADIPNHTICIVWRNAYYGATQKEITFLPNSAKTIFAGYVRGEAEEQEMAKGMGHVDLICSTVEGRLARIYAFSASLVAQQSGVNHWGEIPSWHTVGTIAHTLLRWRCTLFEVTDVIGLRDSTWRRAGYEPDDNNLYEMVNNFTFNEGIRARLVSDQGGRLHFAHDMQLMIDSDRAALSTSFDLQKDVNAADYGGSLIIPRAPEPEAPFVTSNGIFWDGTTFDSEGRPEATGDWCVIAPGGKPLHEGPTPKEFPKQTIPSLQYLRELSGRYLAQTNNPIEEIRLDFAGDYLGVLDVAYDDATYDISLASGDTPRGEVLTNHPLYCRNVAARWRSGDGVWIVEASFEPEAAGITGVETQCPSFPPLGGIIPPSPFPPAGSEFTLPGALMTAASVHAKAQPNDSWALHLAEATKGMIEDPYWRIKTASLAPTNAIMFRCGVGYINRTTDAFIATDVDVTPSSNPPNDAGDSPAPTVGAVLFQQPEGSYATQDEFVFMATWQNASSVWRTWIVRTANNGTSWTWKFISTPAAPPPSGCETDGLEGENLPDDFRGGGADGAPRYAVEVSTNKYVMFYKDDDNVVYLQAFSVSGATITLGTRIDAGLHFLSGITQICKVDTDKFACGTDYHPGASNEPAALVGTVSGLTITVGSVIPVMTSREESQVGLVEYNTVACPDGSTIILGQSRNIISGTPCISTGGRRNLLISGTISGLGITWSTEACDIHTRTVTTDITGTVMGGLSYMFVRESGTGHFVCAMNDNSGTFSIVKIVAGTVGMTMGSVVSVHSDANVFEPSLNLKSLTSTKGVLVYNAETESVGDEENGTALYAVVFNRSGTTITLGTEKLLYDGGPDFNAPFRIELDPLSTTEMVVKARSAAGSGSCDTVWHLSISGNIITIVDQCDDYFDPGGGMELIGRSSGEYIWIRGETAVPVPASVILMDIADLADCSSVPSQEVRGLGMSIGKLGSKIWLTANDDSKLALMEYALPALTQTQVVNLGAATLADTVSQDYLCYPFVPYGFDDLIYVFGRMNNPDGLGNPAHIIRTDNGGTSFTLIEDSWGVDHCGALVIGADARTYAIRNRVGQSKLYRDKGDSIMLLRLTFPWPGQVAPRGLFVSGITDVFVVSYVSDAFMVSHIPPPHLLEKDITFDHATTDPIEVILQL